MTKTDHYLLRWQSELDQLLTGLRRRDKATIIQARKFLALLARDGSPKTLTSIFDALAAVEEAEPLKTETIP